MPCPRSRRFATALALALATAGTSGCGGSGDSGACALPNAILGYVYAPVAAGAAVPPGAIVDLQARSDLIVYVAVTPEGYAPVSDAVVSIVATTLEVATRASGLFTFAGLSGGSYTIRITSVGHEPMEFTGIVCEPGSERYRTDNSYTSSDYSSPSGDSSSSSGSDSSDDGASSSGGDESSSSQSRVLRRRR